MNPKKILISVKYTQRLNTNKYINYLIKRLFRNKKVL